MRSRPLPTPHLLSLHTSAIRLHTSSFLQLFHHQSYGHTFPVPYEPSKSEVHQIPNHPVMTCTEPPHSYSCLSVSYVATLSPLDSDAWLIQESLSCARRIRRRKTPCHAFLCTVSHPVRLYLTPIPFVKSSLGFP